MLAYVLSSIGRTPIRTDDDMMGSRHDERLGNQSWLCRLDNRHGRWPAR